MTEGVKPSIGDDLRFSTKAKKKMRQTKVIGQIQNLMRFFIAQNERFFIAKGLVDGEAGQRPSANAPANWQCWMTSSAHNDLWSLREKEVISIEKIPK